MTSNVRHMQSQPYRKFIIAVGILLWSAMLAGQTQYDTLSTGSFIVNMGVTPQTYNNGLRPYGMVYDLVMNYQVPVKWIIKPNKQREDIDFSHDGVDYRGSSFIIPSEYRTTTVDSRISYWQSRGVIGNTSVSDIEVPVYITITTFPRTVLDDDDNIIKPYYSNADIPSSSYTIGNAASLDCCSDLYGMPHGSPTWSTHGNLYTFITQCGGYYYSSCSNVSEMESISNPDPPYEQLNFLTTEGLQCHANGGQCNHITEFHNQTHTNPVTYATGFGDNPVMQFIGDMHEVTDMGNEQWYIPTTTGYWNPDTKKLIFTDDGDSAREGLKMVYGHAYDNTSNGLVMYHAGHRLTNPQGGVTNAMRTAAQRSYFNFVLMAANQTAIKLNNQQPLTGYLQNNEYYSVSPQGGSAPYTYQWSANVAGTFSNPYGDSTTFTHDPNLPDSTLIIITVLVTDDCGRTNFLSFQRTLIVAFLPIQNISAQIVDQNAVISWDITNPEMVSHFNVYRRLEQETGFSKITEVDNQINQAEQTLSYSDPLKHLPNGIIYYILEAHYEDGTLETSEIVSVNWKHGSTDWLKAYPNPMGNNAIIEVWCSYDAPVILTLTDAMGRYILRKHLQGKKQGIIQFSLSMKEHALQPGIYHISAQLGNQLPVRRSLVLAAGP